MTKPQVIREGYYVALCLVPGTAPQNCYIGLVKATDEYGVRINQVHWDDKLDIIAVSTENKGRVEARDGVALVNKWKKKLSGDELARIEGITGDISRIYYPDDTDWEL